MRIDYLILDIQFSAHGDHLHYFEKKLFTGTAFELGEKEELISETTFENGVESGVSKVWTPNGKPASETNYRDGKKHGMSTEWFPKGKIRMQQR